MLTKTLIPALLAVAPIWLPSQDTFNLRVTAPAGTEMIYKMDMELDMSGQLITLRATNVTKVAKVDENGDYTIESQLKDGFVNVGGEEQAVPDSTSSTKNNAKGEVIEVRANGEELPVESYRYANIMAWSFDQPSYKIGDTITITRQPSKTTGEKSSETVLKLIQFEDIKDKKSVKIEFTSKETSGDVPITVNGTAWVDPSNGMMVKYEATFKNVLFPGAPMPFDGKVSYILN